MSLLADQTPPYAGKHVSALDNTYLGVIQRVDDAGTCTVLVTDGSSRTVQASQMKTAEFAR